MSKARKVSTSVWDEGRPPRSQDLAPHLAGAMEWAERYGAISEALKVANSANRRLWAVILALIVVTGALYKSTRVLVYAADPAQVDGVSLHTTELQQIVDATDVMRRDAVERFFRSLRSSSRDIRYQEVLSRTAVGLTAAGSPAHQAVEAFGERELPARRELEIDAQVTAHLLGEGKWRADIVETGHDGERTVVRAYATLDVSVEAARDVRINPWGVFVRSFSMDPLIGGTR